MDATPFKRAAIAAAYKGAEVLRSRFGKISRVTVKKDLEIVTEADTESEKQIIAAILSRFPEHSILAEECGLIGGGNEYQWLIDPLDGTVNFAHQVPIFCVSIALSVRNETLLGIVLDPLSGELFSAVRGQGARLNDRPIRVSATSAVVDSLLVTGYPYNFREIFAAVMARYGNCLKACRGIRRLGSAALDLCYVASGRFDGYWEENLKPWDAAAGALIASEAGGMVTTFGNRPFTTDQPEILATNGHVHAEMLSLLEIKS